MPTVSYADLLKFAEQLMTAGGANPDESRIVSQSLVEANVRGHDSHGVMRIPFYIGRVREGVIHPGATLLDEQDLPSVLVCRGQWGFGQVLSQELMRRLIDKASATGIASGTLYESAHIGRLGEYAEMAAERGMAAIICANTHGAAQRVAPVGGKRPRLGTNPLCIGIPGGAEGPFVLDFGTSATAEGKVRVKKIAGEPTPLGWILDSDGKPTTDPNALYGDPPGTILPMGGDQAYKGFGLAFMIEMLCGGFSPGVCAHPNPPPPVGNCAFFLVLDPRSFAGIQHLEHEARKLEEYVRTVERVDGCERITLPGDPERQVAARRRAEGIPIDPGNWKALLALAEELSVAAPG